MLAAVTRYAIGLVYEKDSESYKELILLKNMIMREFSQKKIIKYKVLWRILRWKMK